MSLADFENMPQMTESEKESVRHLFPTYFFYRNITRSRREAVCSSCGTKLYAHKTIDGRILGYEDLWGAIRDKEDECPNCGAEGVYKPANVYRDMASLHCYQNIVWFFPFEDGQTVYAGAYSVISIYSPDDQAKLEFVEKAKYLFRPGYSSCVWRSVCLYNWCFDKSTLAICQGEFAGELGHWKVCKKVREPWQSMFNNACCGYFLPNLDILQESFFRYSCYDLFMNISPITRCGWQGTHRELMVFLREYCNRPAMEIALRCKGEDAVKELVYRGVVGGGKFNWKAKSPMEFYGVTKAIWNELRKANIDVSEFRVRADFPLTLEKVKIFLDLYDRKDIDIDKACRLIKLSSLLCQSPYKIRNYITKQQRTVYYYHDYVSAGYTLAVDFTDLKNVFPKDLKEAHDNAIELQQEYFDRKLQARYEKTLQTREKRYSYSEDQYFIRLPKDGDEIVAEGRALHHCVGRASMGYVGKHLKGKTTILFMRAVTDPDKPLYTIQMNDDVLIQVHGYGNCELKLDEQKAFFNRWLQFVKTGKRPEIPVESSEENQVKVG